MNEIVTRTESIRVFKHTKYGLFDSRIDQ